MDGGAVPRHGLGHDPRPEAGRHLGGVVPGAVVHDDHGELVRDAGQQVGKCWTLVATREDEVAHGTGRGHAANLVIGGARRTPEGITEL
ncbi:hypothetical protein GCM10027425_30330 [Alteromonas gracilis]